MISNIKCQTCYWNDWGVPSEQCEQCIGYSRWKAQPTTKGDAMAMFACTKCGYVKHKPTKCPYTGMEAGSGFKYICPVCRADLDLTVRSCENCQHSDASGGPSTFPLAACYDCSRLGNWRIKTDG